MDDLRKAAEMALEYFEEAHGLEDAEVEIKEALRQALAIEEQISLEYCDRCGWKAIAPPEGCLICDRKKWVGLTDEETRECYEKENPVEATEDKLKEKNHG